MEGEGRGSHFYSNFHLSLVQPEGKAVLTVTVPDNFFMQTEDAQTKRHTEAQLGKKFRFWTKESNVGTN